MIRLPFFNKKCLPKSRLHSIDNNYVTHMDTSKKIDKTKNRIIPID